MKERPILFTGPMVRAILEGRKTQTRRVVKPRVVPIVDECFKVNGKWCNHTFGYELGELCPYGIEGDRLWVRETFCTAGAPGDFDAVQYRADEDCPTTTWKPSIFMPRWASRITLEITGVRVERLTDIRAVDCIAEGIESHTVSIGMGTVTTFRDYLIGGNNCAAYNSYKSLWESINGPGSWDANPWVWVIEFRRGMP